MKALEKYTFHIIVILHIYSDDDTQQDIFDDKSDDEKEEEEGEEAKWRKDRYEREKWLQEQQVLIHTERTDVLVRV